MAKKKKSNKKPSKSLSIKEVEEQKLQLERQRKQSIIDESKNAVKNLTSKINKEYKFNLIKKNNANKIMNKLNLLIQKEEIDELEQILIRYKEIEKEEKTKEKEVIQTKRSFKERIKYFFKNFRYPIYSRTKKIILNEQGNTKIIKLSFLYFFVFLLVALMVVGILMFANVIPFFIEGKQNYILPSLLVALPIGIMYFV